MCVYFYALSPCNCKAVLFQLNAVISWPDLIAAARGQRLCVCLCVHASHFAILCLNVCCGAKWKMIAREKREEINVGAFWKPWVTCAQTHTNCSCDRINTCCLCLLCAHLANNKALQQFVTVFAWTEHGSTWPLSAVMNICMHLNVEGAGIRNTNLMELWEHNLHNHIVSQPRGLSERLESKFFCQLYIFSQGSIFTNKQEMAKCSNSFESQWVVISHQSTAMLRQSPLHNAALWLIWRDFKTLDENSSTVAAGNLIWATGTVYRSPLHDMSIKKKSEKIWSLKCLLHLSSVAISSGSPSNIWQLFGTTSPWINLHRHCYSTAEKKYSMMLLRKQFSLPVFPEKPGHKLNFK